MNTNDILSLAAGLAERGRPHALVTVVRAIAPTSAYVGAMAIVEDGGALHGWIGGGCAQSVVIGAAQEAMASGAPKLVRISNDGNAADPGTEQHAMPCASNGSIELFIQPSMPARVLVLGDTPAAREARELAQRMGFEVTGDVAAAPQFALVATQGEGDHQALQTALDSAAQHVLLIASRRKAESLVAAMRDGGVSEQRLARLQAPAGPHIGAQTPAEIALAAVAGLVALRRAAPHIVKPVAAGKYINPVCGIAVAPASAMHTVEYQGAKFYFCCDGCKLEFEKEPGRYAAIQAERLRTAAEATA